MFPKYRKQEPAMQAMPVSSSHQEEHDWKTELKTGEDRFSHSILGTVCLASLMLVQPAVNAEVFSQSPYFKGGKIDTFYDRKDNGDFQTNEFLWTPVFKGGHGVIVSENGGQDTNYFGGYARPLLIRPDLGDLFLGAQEVLQGDSKQTEAQGEYRLPNGLGIGGGFVDRKFSNQDVKFAKVSYQNQWQGIRYIMSTQWQNFAGQDYPGGYVGLYNKALMATWGSDGEQWRSSFGYIGPESNSILRPAVEVLYIDNSIGKVSGSKDLMISGSLGFRKGFLSHEARLGRAMGPTGMQFTNPQAHLQPTFNRRLTAWELGELVDFRYINKALPNAGREETFEAVIFPGQLLRDTSLLSSVFVGTGVTSPNPGANGTSGIIGYLQRFKHVESNVRVQHDFDRDDTSLYFGAIYWL
ncbi:MAG: hypothetical protein ACXWF8_19225 [Methylobacter sp.]